MSPLALAVAAVVAVAAVLAAVTFATPARGDHRCVHDDYESLPPRVAARAKLRKEYGAPPDTARLALANEAGGGGGGGPKRDVRATEPLPPWQPIRIRMDYRYLVPSWDPLGLCQQIGDWVRLGNPGVYVDHDASAHRPLCTPTCERHPGNATNNNHRGCNCYYQCTREDLLFRQRRDFVYRLFNESVAFLERTLEVRRRPITLRAQNCGCGNEIVPVNETRADRARFPNDVAATAQYVDYTDADLVLFVTTRSSRFVNDDTLAYACSCDEDTYFLRPTFGHINWSTNKIDYLEPDKFDEQLGVAIHEITHALGFTNTRYERFIDPAQFDNGADIDPTRSAVRLDAADVRTVGSVAVDTADGKRLTNPLPVTKIVTPRALAEARAHFACDALDGVELENQGANGTASSHWEKRLLENEYMTASSSYLPVRSRITLAFLEDTGYYRANLSAADALFWGRGEGCSFVAPRCTAWQGAYRCNADTLNHWGCTPDRLMRGICQINRYPGGVPEFFRYETDPQLGGTQLSDYCAFYRYNEGLKSDCRLEAHQANHLFERGEMFGPNSRCFDSTLLNERKQGLVGSGGCHPVLCDRSDPSSPRVFVRVVNELLECTPSEELRVASYNGRLKCPSAPVLAQMCDAAPSFTRSDDATGGGGGGTGDAGALAFPVIDSVSPPAAVLTEGTVLTVSGRHFVGPAAIVIGDLQCTNFTLNTTTAIECVVEQKHLAAATPVTAAPRAEDGSPLAVLQDVKNFFFKDNAGKPEPGTVVDVAVNMRNGLVAIKTGAFTIEAARTSAGRRGGADADAAAAAAVALAAASMSAAAAVSAMAM